MTKLFWNALKLSPVILGAMLLLANRTQASQAPVVKLAPSSAAVVTAKTTTSLKPVVSSVQPQLLAERPVESQAPDTLAQETSVSQLSTPEPDALAQVTSVSQLSDVQPTDWAFQALQSLVERYGCIAGYPDGTYRGNRAMTRYEFAAGLNACLDRVNELIAAATTNQISREDLATLQRLQEEFSAELATLRGRVDALEARTAEVEANQFSTTTTLAGEAIFAVADVFSSDLARPFGIGEDGELPDDLTPGELAALSLEADDFELLETEDDDSLGDLDEEGILAALEEGEATGAETLAELFAGDVEDELDANTIFADRIRLNFDASFFGEDRLRVRLQARNIEPFDQDVTGTSMTRLGFDGDNGNDIEIDDLYYRFPIGEVLLVQIDAANTEFNDNVFTFNPAFESSGSGAISRFGRFNPIYRQGEGGAGLTVTFNPEGVFTASAGYLAPQADTPESGFGVFNGAYAAMGQVGFRPNDNINIGVTYAHTYQNQENEINSFSSTGSLLANRPFGNFATEANHYGVQASVRLSDVLTLSGWGGFSQLDAESGPFEGAEAEAWNWAATLALQDFGLEGSVLGLIFGQPPKVTDSDVFEDEDTSYHVEALYKFRLTDNIAITPGFLLILNPEHNSDNNDIYVGTVRTTFTF